MKKPLEGIRIADFSWVGAGSYTTKILADLGADVIKIESSEKLDSLRLSPPFSVGNPGVNRSGYFADRNTNKRSLTLNMKTGEGLEIARELVAVSDVVCNNFSPGVMAKFGLAYEDVQLINRSAIYLAMSMNGSTGPESDARGYGFTISALVGLHHLSGLPGELPVGSGTNYPDHIPNPCHAAFAVLAALRHKRRTGKGQFIDLAQTEATIVTLGSEMLEWTVNGNNRQPQGNRHDRYSPHGVYPCSGDDRWIAIAITDDQKWKALIQVLNLSNDTLEPAWSNADSRIADAGRLDEIVAGATRKYDAPSLAYALQQAGVPAGQVHDSKGVAARDPQLKARGHWKRIEHPEMGKTLYNGQPFQLSRTPAQPDRPAPLLGQHNVEICHELLGMPLVKIEELIDQGVLR